MKEGKTIPARIEKDLIFDYRNMRQFALALVQKFSSDIWTDYNEHDPGVTILENLCYTLTDLAYRTQYPIEDLLIPEKGETLNSGDNAFYPPHEIYPVNPVNTSDLRKYLIDAMDEVNNVWIGKGSNLGQKHVWLLLNDNVPPGQQDLMIEKTKKAYQQVRNLCEDLERVQVLKRKEITIQCEFHIDENTRAETVMASALYRIERFFNPSPRFYSVSELKAKGFTSEQMFDGPALSHGHILNRELHPFRQKIDLSDLIKRLINVKGVNSIHNFRLVMDGKAYTGVVECPDFVPKLQAYTLFTSVKSGIQFLVKNVPIVLNLDLVKETLNRIQARRNRSYRIKSQEDNATLPQGTFRNLANYYSFQNDFPILYNVGSFGMGPEATIAERSSAHQLKAYLMFYDQLFANFLQQTSQLKRLFSIQNEKQSTFYQIPDQVPRFWEVLKSADDPIQDVPDTDELQQLKEWYEKELDGIRQEFDDYAERRNAFLDNLLARFGEAFRSYSLSKFNYYYSDEKFEEHMIRFKADFLRHYVGLSRNRGRGINQDVSSWQSANVAGLHRLLCLLLTVTNWKNRSLVKHIDQAGFSLFKVKNETQKIESEENEDEDSKVELDLNQIEIINMEAAWSEEFKLDPSSERMLFSSHSPDVLNQVLFNGVQRENYRIFRDPLVNDRFDLLLQLDQKGRWLNLKQCESRPKARLLRKKLIAFLIDVSVKSEGLYLVEHLLLKPVKEPCADDTAPPVEEENIPEAQSTDEESLPTETKESIEEEKKKQQAADEEEKDPFYYGQLSLIFPAWPARFQNESFRALTLEMVQSLLPAHLLARCYWLDLEVMRDFEADYQQWLMALHGGPAKEERNVLSARLTEALKSFAQEPSRKTIFKRDDWAT